MLKNNLHTVVTLNFAGHTVQLRASGACYLPQQKILIVADLHLEKGSYFALRGDPIPLSDTRNTLEKLQQELLHLKPDTVICLGDNVHDASGFMRMRKEDISLLQSICTTNVTKWLWIIGNHDTTKLEIPVFEKMHLVSEVLIDNLCFTHEYQKDKCFQIIGHYHPKISIKKQGVKITGKCFSLTKNTLIMPAFGSYTGGLDIHDKAYSDILLDNAKYYLLFKNNIFLAQ